MNTTYSAYPQYMPTPIVRQLLKLDDFGILTLQVVLTAK